MEIGGNKTRTKILFSSLLLLFATLLLLPSTTPVHAQFTGTVCIISSGSTACPSTGTATIRGTVGTQLRVSVFIQGSDGLGGFDITLLADHTILKPAGFDLTGTVLAGPQVVLTYCQGGVLIQGSACTSTDTIDTLELAASDCLGCGNTAPPTTGLLFTAIYNVTTDSSGTPLGFQSGNSVSCTPSSVMGTNTCVIIASPPSSTPAPETTRTAVFTTSGFTMSASPNTLTVPRGGHGASTITLTSVGSFAGIVTLSTSTAPSGKAPSTSLGPNSVTLTSGGSGSATLTVAAGKHTALGTYIVTVTGTSGTISSSVSVTVTVTR